MTTAITNGGTVPKCGTEGTPPCPPPDPLLETRELVINELAGPGASTERRCAITAQVDTFLQVALHGAFALLRGSGALQPARPARPSSRKRVTESKTGDGSKLKLSRGATAHLKRVRRKR